MTQVESIVKTRRSLLVFAERQGITAACKAFNISRTAFYKIKKQFVLTGSLEPRIRRKPRMPNEMSLTRKKILLRLVQENPSYGPVRYRGEFQKLGIILDTVSIWRYLKKFGLNKRYQRLLYIEQSKEQNAPLTEKAIKKLKRSFYNIKRGLWPGHIVALDTFCVGQLKGVGRIYQITGIDLCSRFGWAKLYTTKDQSSTIDFVENTLLPKFFLNEVEIESVLSDNGTEFTGSKFREMLEAYEIKHHRIPRGKPIFNGYCERFQRTINEEFYQKQFRVRFFASLKELQTELDKYLVKYNFERTHYGISKKGEIPVNVFKSHKEYLKHRFQNL